MTVASEAQSFPIPDVWTFDREDISSIFDKHVREELPWYDIVTRAIRQIARHYITEGGLVYDVGASTGNIGRAIGDIVTSRKARFIAVEKSKEMAKQYKAVGELLVQDALNVTFENADLIICYLILMFLGPEEKTKLTRKLMASLKDGGALVIVDKRVAENGYIGTVLSRLTLSEKLNSGVVPERIISKELSLAGVQRPMRPEDVPKNAVEFFRFGEFSGWIVENNKAIR